MAIITKTLSITGEEEILTAGILLVARSGGWKARIIVNGTEIDNPTTAEMAAESVLKKFLRSTAQAQAVKEAREAASTAAHQQALAVLDNLTMTLETTNG